MNGAILEEASRLINGERQQDYGNPGACFGKIAAMWGAYLGHDLSRVDVANMMCLLKLARESQYHKHDNLLDACGYLALAADMAGYGGDHADCG